MILKDFMKNRKIENSINPKMYKKRIIPAKHPNSFIYIYMDLYWISIRCLLDLYWIPIGPLLNLES